jgi:RNA polymerase sigma factor (sigma-70 family)
MLTEQELIKGCAKRDRGCQKALYEMYCGKMMAICLRYSKSGPEAEDILQEGFLKIFDNIKNFRGESKLLTWMTRIMINAALNQNRQKLYLLPMVDVNDVALIETEEVSLGELHCSELIRMIQSLPDGCQIIFNLFALEGYSHKEIAEMLNISEGTSKSQHNRARNLLQAMILDDYGKYGQKRV